MSAPLARSLSTREDWRALADDARGSRQVRFSRGLPQEIALSDGRRLHLAHDPEGGLSALHSDDGFRVDIERLGQAALRLRDPLGTTQIAAQDGRRTLVRDGIELAIGEDAAERPLRVELPGLTLLYDWSQDGSCAVKILGGPELLRVEPHPEGLRYVLPDGSSWDEHAAAGARTLRAYDGTGQTLGGVSLELDALGRTLSRRYDDGATDEFRRDDRGRLSAWVHAEPGAEAEARHYRYAGDELVHAAGWDREVGPGGRVLSQRGSDGAEVRYEYDAAGRRVRHADTDGETRYGYDALGQLLYVERPDGRRVEYAYDGLGRRVSASGADGTTRRELRDERGRLWAVLDGDGRLLHAFVHLGHRVLARLAQGALDEAYLLDPLGTPLLALRPGSAPRPAVLLRLAAPPFGAIAEARPTLYGHFADPDTGLVHFGARDLDPALGLFLTPDPWHGGLDDPRRFSPQGDAELTAELPSGGVHAYALCQFDPVGRLDLDGHASFLGWLRFFLLAPTWGWAQTALSLFFFLPLNLYFEIFGLIIWAGKAIFTKDTQHPWRHHTIAKSVWGGGSTRQAAFALSLCGFLPRVSTVQFHLEESRAVTIGNVMWINHDELSELERRVVIDTNPTGLNSDPLTESVVALISTRDGKEQVHVSQWTRGMGTAVTGAAQQMEGGVIHLFTPLPEDFKAPPDDDSAKLVLEEYRHGAADRTALTTASAPSFVVVHADLNQAAAGDLLELTADAAFGEPIVVATQVAAPKATIVPWTRPAGAAVTVKKVAKDPAATAIAGFSATPGTPTLLQQPATAPMPLFEKGLTYVVTASGDEATIVLPATMRKDSAARAAGLQLTVELSAPLPGATGALELVTPAGSGMGKVAPGQPKEIKLEPPQPGLGAAVGDVLVVHGATQRICVRVETASASLLTVGEDLVAGLGLAAPATVTLRRYVSSGAPAVGQVVAQPSDRRVTASVDRSTALYVGQLLLGRSGGVTALREITSMVDVRVELHQAPLGTAPYTLQKATVAAFARPVSGAPIEQAEYVLTAGSVAMPTDLGVYPAKLLGIRAKGDDMSEMGYYRRAAAGDPITIARAIPGKTYELWEFVRAGVRREGVTAHPPEVQVPEDVHLHDTYKRALLEHELHHTVQSNLWGPLMSSLPIPALGPIVDDIVRASGNELPNWLKYSLSDWDTDFGRKWFGGLGGLTLASIGGIMFLAWRYVFLWPLLTKESWRDKLSPENYVSWSKVVNPLWALVLSRLQAVDPKAGAGERWGLAAARLLRHALDLRSWTPFLGIYFLNGPGAPTNFMEQQASRASGDLYSDLITADDRYNFKLERGADLQRLVGDAVRLMLWPVNRLKRIMRVGQGNRPGSPIDDSSIGTVSCTASALFHPDLYTDIGGGTTVTLDGPSGASVAFLLTKRVRARARALVPTPPRVSRSIGFYFIPSDPGAYTASYGTFSAAATESATLTFTSQVQLGAEDVPWQQWRAAPPATVLSRFVTETAVLKTPDPGRYACKLRIDPASAGPAKIDQEADPGGFRLRMSSTVDATAGNNRIRLRLYRVFGKDDPSFDLTYDEKDLPGLSGVRSFLVDPVWIPVRDFLIEVQDLPNLPAASTTSDSALSLDLPISPEVVHCTPKAGGPNLPAKKSTTPSSAPRGVRFDLGPLAEPIEEDLAYQVDVSYGHPPAQVKRSFVLTVQPAIRLTVAAGPYEARVGKDLELSIQGGAAPYTLDAPGRPADSAIELKEAKILIKVAKPPAEDTRVILTVTDKAGKKGRRTIAIKKA